MHPYVDAPLNFHNMKSNKKLLDLMAKPSCTLTAVESYVLNRFMEDHPDDVERALKDIDPDFDMSLIPDTKKENVTEYKPGTRLFLKGYKQIMSHFHISNSTCHRVIKSGLWDDALVKMDKSIILDAELATIALRGKGRIMSQI